MTIKEALDNYGFIDKMAVGAKEIVNWELFQEYEIEKVGVESGNSLIHIKRI